MLASCMHKQQVIPSNKQNGSDTPAQSIVHHYFKGKYLLYDSTHHWWSNGRGWIETYMHYTISRTIDILMDSTDNYIAVGKDTFRTNKSEFAYIPGYYSLFISPVWYNKIVISNDSVRFAKTIIGASHDGTDEYTYGYRLP